jgi:hypothetical protein
MTSVFAFEDDQELLKLQQELLKPEFDLVDLGTDPESAFSTLMAKADQSTPFLVLVDLYIGESGRELYDRAQRQIAALIAARRPGNWSFPDEHFSYLAGYVLLRCLLAEHPRLRDRCLVLTGHGVHELLDRLVNLGWKFVLKGNPVVVRDELAKMAQGAEYGNG